MQDGSCVLPRPDMPQALPQIAWGRLRIYGILCLSIPLRKSALA